MPVGSVIGRSIYGGVSVRDAPVPAAPAIRPRLAAFIAVAAFVALGLALRLMAARHDLWLDEIWSIDLVQGLSSPDQVFWRISHDNNHFLNSLWLYALGPDREPMLYRLPAVLLGTLSVLVGARIGLRRSAATGVAAAALVSTSSLLVNYGSEARGYAGLILALLVGIDAFERSVERPSGDTSTTAPAGADRQRWVLGAAIGIGALFHMTMVAALPLFGAAAVLRRRDAGASWGQAVGDALSFLRPALILLLPVMACVMAGIVARGGLAFGGTSPFTVQHAIEGVGGALRLASGLPETVPPWAACILCGVALVGVTWLDPARRWLIVGGTMLLPCGLLALGLPNLEFPRYFLIPAILFILASADVAGALWDKRAPWARLTAGALLAAILLGQAASLDTLITLGRGSYTAVVDRMASSDSPAYASDARFQVETVVDFIAARQHRSVSYVGPGEFCLAHPRWYIDTDDGPQAKLPDRIDVGPASCRASFAKTVAYPTSALSGMTWTLYRRSD